MTLKIFAFQEAATGANWNAGVDDMPDGLCYVLTPEDSEFRGTAGLTVKVGTLKVRPAQARYLCIKCQAKRLAATNGVATFKLAFGGNEVTVSTFTAASTSYADFSDVVDLETEFVVGGTTIDVTGEDVDLLMYVDEHVSVRLVEVYGGQSSVVADYGG